jgi:hypothetical protein
MRWTLWIAFAALCILSGTSWAIADDVSEGLPQLEQQGLLFGVLGMIALLVVGREVWLRIRNLQWARLAAAGVVFFGFRRLTKKRQCCRFGDTLRVSLCGVNFSRWQLRCTSWLRVRTLGSISL